MTEVATKEVIPRVRVAHHCHNAINNSANDAEYKTLNSRLNKLPKDDASRAGLQTQLKKLKESRHTVSSSAVTGLAYCVEQVIRDLVLQGNDSVASLTTKTVNVKNLFTGNSTSHPFVGLLNGLPEFTYNEAREKAAESELAAHTAAGKLRLEEVHAAIKTDLEAREAALPATLSADQKKAEIKKIKTELMNNYNKAHPRPAVAKPASDEDSLQSFEIYVKKIRHTIPAVASRVSTRFNTFVDEVVSAFIARIARVALQTAEASSKKRSAGQVQAQHFNSAITQQMTLAGFSQEQITAFFAHVQSFETAESEKSAKKKAEQAARKESQKTPLTEAQAKAKETATRYARCSPEAITRKEQRIATLQKELEQMRTDSVTVAAQLKAAQDELKAAEAKYPEELKAQQDRSPGRSKKPATA